MTWLGRHTREQPKINKNRLPFGDVTGYTCRWLGNFAPHDFEQRYRQEVLTPGQQESSVFEPVPNLFAPGQPDCLFDGEGTMPYRGQYPAKRRIQVHTQGLRGNDRLKFLLTGPAGTGKTSLARITAHLIQERREACGLPRGAYFELLPAQVDTKELLDTFMLEVVKDPFAIVFIDEIGEVTVGVDLYHVLHDSGDLWYPLANGRRLEVPRTISWLGATTDKGKLHEAMIRRLEPEIRLTAPSTEELAEIVLDLGEIENLPVHSDAAWEIAYRSTFPWEAKLIYSEAKLVASVANSQVLLPGHADEAFEMMEIDGHGLRREDRDVIQALLRAPVPLVTRPGVTRYKLSEDALCTAAGVDKHTYSKRIKPKLVTKGLLVVAGGQCLTDKAVQMYSDLRN